MMYQRPDSVIAKKASGHGYGVKRLIFDALPSADKILSMKVSG